MRKTILASLIAFLTLPSSHAFAQTVLDDSFPLDAGVTIDQMHSAVSGDFLDPASAQYKGLVLRNKGYKPAICGLVNAKNSMGGYTPFYPFAYSIERGVAKVGDDYNDEILGKLTVMTLQNMGCPLSSVGL